MALGFSIDQGKQFIHCRGERYYLAKSNTLAAFAVPTGTRIHQWNKDLTSRDDGVALTFRFKDHDVSYDSGGKAKPIPPVQRIDKLSKTKMKPYLDKFRQWRSLWPRCGTTVATTKCVKLIRKCLNT